MMGEMSDSPKIHVEHAYKIFGSNPSAALDVVKTGKSREVIKEETDQLVALRDITFDIMEGEIFVLMGLSGSGKSTLLRCINRLHDITSGTIHVNSTDVRSLSPNQLRSFRRETFGMVFQHFALFPHRTVLENVEFGLEIQGIQSATRHQKGHEVLETVGLSQWADNKTGELSGGMQQRVGLARALAVDPEILLMDEPFSALDPLIRTNLQDELLKLHSEMKKTILFVTHDLNEAIKIGDRIAILDDQGRVVQVDDPETILLSPANEYVERFLGDVDRPSVIRIESVMQEPSTLTSPADATHHVNKLATIKEVLPYALSSDKPVAVINDDNELVGEITRGSLSAILSTEAHGARNTAHV